MQIDWVSSVIKKLCSNEHISKIFPADSHTMFEHIPLSYSEEDRASDPFLRVIMFYCVKSLEFPHPILVQTTPSSCELLSPPYE